MTKLYVSNCTAQHQDFSFRVPGTGQLITQKIPAGGQIMIYRETDQETLQQIADQHRKYGLIPVSEIDRTKPFISMCYQFDRPITQNHIAYGVQHNTDVLTELGQERRAQAAVAISDNLDQAAAASTGQSHVKQVKLELTEEKQNGDNSPGVAEEILVDKNPNVKGISRKKTRG